MLTKLNGAHRESALGDDRGNAGSPSRNQGAFLMAKNGLNMGSGSPMSAGAGKSSGPGFKLKSNMKLEGSGGKVGASGGTGDKITAGAKRGGK